MFYICIHNQISFIMNMMTIMLQAQPSAAGGSMQFLIMMVLILISLSILRKADPNGEGGGIA